MARAQQLSVTADPRDKRGTIFSVKYALEPPGVLFGVHWPFVSREA